MLRGIAEIAEIKNFKIGRSGQSAKDSREAEELALRYFAFKESVVSYNDNLAKFLDKYMEKSPNFTAGHIAELKSEFIKSLEACKIIFNGNEIFSDISKDRRRQGVVYYDLLMGSLGSVDPAVLQAKREEIRTAFSDLCSSAEFRRLTAGGLQRKTSIARRNKLWDDKLQAAIQ